MKVQKNKSEVSDALALGIVITSLFYAAALAIDSMSW